MMSASEVISTPVSTRCHTYNLIISLSLSVLSVMLAQQSNSKTSRSLKKAQYNTTYTHIGTYDNYCYLRQVNEVNGGDNVFVRCVSVCVFACVCARSGRSWELNANSSKMVTATDFKFDTSLPRDSPDMTPKNFFQKGAWRGHVTP